MHETTLNHVELGRLMRAFIRAGWSPPRRSKRFAPPKAEDNEISRDRISGGGGGDARVNLSPQQHAALTLTAAGLNGPEAADVMHIAPETVRSHLKQARHHLGACTLAQAVAIALKAGIIDLPSEGRQKTLAA